MLDGIEAWNIFMLNLAIYIIRSLVSATSLGALEEGLLVEMEIVVDVVGCKVCGLYCRNCGV